MNFFNYEWFHIFVGVLCSLFHFAIVIAFIFRSALSKIYYNIHSDSGFLHVEDTVEPESAEMISTLKSNANLDVFVDISQDVHFIYVNGYIAPHMSDSVSFALLQAWTKQEGIL